MAIGIKRRSRGPDNNRAAGRRTFSFILSNSSMRQMPRSASTSAPPSSVHSRVMGSFVTVAVRPTAEAPLPVVYTARVLVCSTYFRNCDLAVPGSPMRSTLMSPLQRSDQGFFFFFFGIKLCCLRQKGFHEVTQTARVLVSPPRRSSGRRWCR